MRGVEASPACSHRRAGEPIDELCHCCGTHGAHRWADEKRPALRRAERRECVAGPLEHAASRRSGRFDDWIMASPNPRHGAVADWGLAEWGVAD
jgi:hypothetical protein